MLPLLTKDINEIQMTLEATEKYLKSLRELEEDMKVVVEQVNCSCDEAEQSIRRKFDEFIEDMTLTLNNRREILLSRVQQIRSLGLGPLIESGNFIKDKMGFASKLLEDGKSILEDGENIDDFYCRAKYLGHIPEIPQLSEVPFVTFQYDEHIKDKVIDKCAKYGKISPKAPVQISGLQERPGAILVEWEVVENDEQSLDIQEFCLQMRSETLLDGKRVLSEFIECYKGSDTHFLVKDLQVGTSYAFRICCKFEGESKFSEWSVPQVKSTSIKPYSWKSNPDFDAYVDNRIAKAWQKNPRLLVSDGPQFLAGYSIDFTILETENQDFTVGLIDNYNLEEMNDLADCKSCFVVKGNGEIWVDGFKKSLQLAEIKKGTKVTFMCELVNNNKIRMNIDYGDKRVTYEWQVCQDSFYFIGLFKTSKAKILVE